MLYLYKISLYKKRHILYFTLLGIPLCSKVMNEEDETNYEIEKDTLRLVTVVCIYVY